MSDTEWTKERAGKPIGWDERRFADARAKAERCGLSPRESLLLLDELERVTRERDELTEGLSSGRLLVNAMHPDNATL